MTPEPREVPWSVVTATWTTVGSTALATAPTFVVGMLVWLLTGVLTEDELAGDPAAGEALPDWCEATVPATPPATADATIVPATTRAMPRRLLRRGASWCGGGYGGGGVGGPKADDEDGSAFWWPHG
jgi:hypothetical protein